MFKLGRIVPLVGLLIVSLMLVGGGASGQEPTTIVLGTIEDMDNLDPAVTNINANMRLIYMIYDGLTTFGEDPSKVYPCLATSWGVSEDGLTWTFHLRDDVYFEDGTHFDSSVVKFSFDRLLAIGLGPSEPFTVIKDILTPEPYTVKFVLERPFAPFLWTVTSVFARIVAPSVMEHEKDGDWGKAWLSDHTVGSGPFRLKSWTKGQRLVLETKRDYWGTAPKVDQVIIRSIKEPVTLKMELLVGTIDIAEGILIEDLAELATTEGVEVVSGPSFRWTYIYGNVDTTPFKGLRVRKAVAYAIDYPAIIEGVLRGHVFQMEGPWAIGMWGKPQKLPLYERNLPLARQLMAEAGYADGFTITCAFSAPHNFPEIVSVIQSNLRDIGITVKLVQYAWPTYISKIMGHEVEMGIIGLSPDYPDPGQLAWLAMHSTGVFNLPNYKSEAIDRLLEEGYIVQDQERRAEIYQELQLFQHELVPNLYLFQDKFDLPMRSWVKGYHYNPDMHPLIPFQDMWVEK